MKAITFLPLIGAVLVSTLGVNLVFAEDDETFSFFLDKSRYDKRDVIQISGWVNTINGPEIFFEIINPG